MIITAIAGMLTGQIHAPSELLEIYQVLNLLLVLHLNHLKIQDNYLRYNF